MYNIKFFLYYIFFSLHGGLNSGPSVYKTDALPLSYKGLCILLYTNTNYIFFLYYFKNIKIIDNNIL